MIRETHGVHAAQRRIPSTDCMIATMPPLCCVVLFLLFRCEMLLLVVCALLASAAAQPCQLLGVWTGFFPDPLGDRYYMQPQQVGDVVSTGVFEVRLKSLGFQEQIAVVLGVFVTCCD
jgi:hypothetical protein